MPPESKRHTNLNDWDVTLKGASGVSDAFFVPKEVGLGNLWLIGPFNGATVTLEMSPSRDPDDPAFWQSPVVHDLEAASSFEFNSAQAYVFSNVYLTNCWIRFSWGGGNTNTNIRIKGT